MVLKSHSETHYSCSRYGERDRVKHTLHVWLSGYLPWPWFCVKDRMCVCTWRCVHAVVSVYQIFVPDCPLLRFLSADQLHTSVSAGTVYQSCMLLVQSFWRGMQNRNRRLNMLLVLLYKRGWGGCRHGLANHLVLLKHCCYFLFFILSYSLRLFFCVE